MTKAILTKLTAELEAGITTQAQVVYVLAGIRKIIERDRCGNEYPALAFHCDWALHADVGWSRDAKAILKRFEPAYVQLHGRVDVGTLPNDIRDDIQRISAMEGFRAELAQFEAGYALRAMRIITGDGWSRFLHLYAQVVEDMPLLLAEGDGRISKIVVHFGLAPDVITDGYGRSSVTYWLTWTIHDQSGVHGEVFVQNDFEIEQPQSQSGHNILGIGL